MMVIEAGKRVIITSANELSAMSCSRSLRRERYFFAQQLVHVHSQIDGTNSIKPFQGQVEEVKFGNDN